MRRDGELVFPGLRKTFLSAKLLVMIQVKRKDAKEANENLLRRFNRRVLQSGVVSKAKAAQRFSKPQSKRDRRDSAIIREQRKADKALQIRMGLAKPSR